MARRRSAAEQIGVPELDEQEAEARVAATEAALEARAQAAATEAALEAQAAPVEQRPEWLPDNFKTPQDLAKSYRELQNQLRERGNRERQLEARMAELEEEAADASRPESTDEWERVEAAYESDPLGTMQWLAQQTAAAAVQQAFGQRAKAAEPRDKMEDELFAKAVDDLMTNEYDDWDEIKPTIAERLAEDQSLLPDHAFSSLASVKKHMSMIYKDIQYDRLMEEQKELRERGLQQKDLDRARKQEAQTLSGATGRAPEPSEAEKELAEMRAALADTSYGLHRAQEKQV